jgi:transcriptional regulator with XRE-family HTH domain
MSEEVEKSGPGQSFQGMTIKEIVELCGVKKQTILNWAHKLEVLNQKIWLRISEKLAQGSPENPANFTLEETLAIIGEGGGNKMLAALLAENAANKDVLAKGHYHTNHYGEHAGPAGYAASKVYDLMVKYRNVDDKVSRQDTIKLFECATSLRRYFYDTAMVTDELVIYNTALEQRLLRTCHKLGISQEDIPTFRSWDKKEWPDFPELSAPKKVPLLE